MAGQAVCKLGELRAGQARCVTVTGAAGSVEVAVVHDENGKIHAVNDICTHGAVSLSDGDVEGDTIECWLHGSRFDLETGEPLSPPAVRPVAVYAVEVDGDDIVVDVDTVLNN